MEILSGENWSEFSGKLLWKRLNSLLSQVIYHWFFHRRHSFTFPFPSHRLHLFTCIGSHPRECTRHNLYTLRVFLEIHYSVVNLHFAMTDNDLYGLFLLYIVVNWLTAFLSPQV